jgi:carbon-monoxide dehydrogenase medium subunit
VYSFNYHLPDSVAEAVAILKANDEAKAISGGMSLLPTLKLRLARPSDIVDLGAIAELKGISDSKGVLKIGAGTTHAQVAASADVASAIPALATLASCIGDPQVRNRGTIGGSIANADPAADYPAAAVGLGATISTDRRQIPADDFFTASFETALEADEVVTSVSFPHPKRAGYAKFSNLALQSVSSVRKAIVGVMVVENAAGIRVAVTGARGSVFRIGEMEDALQRDFSPDALAGITVSADVMNEDLHATAEFRAHLVTVMAERAVIAANSRHR